MLFKKFFLGFVVLTLTSFASATTLKAGSGIDITVINGEKVDGKTVELQPGENQLVLEFGGRLKDGGKDEYLSFYPYVAVINSNGYQNIEVSTLSNQYNKIEKLSDDKKPVYKFVADGKEIDSKQFVLPAPAGAFPYRDVLALITNYNKENGLVFESGKIRSLKKEIEQVNGGKAVTGETENILQLKLWYSRANPEERTQFEQWVKSQS